MFSWKYLFEACSGSFCQSTKGLVPDLHPEIFAGVVEGQQLQWLMIELF